MAPVYNEQSSSTNNNGSMQLGHTLVYSDHQRRQHQTEGGDSDGNDRDYGGTEKSYDGTNMGIRRESKSVNGKKDFERLKTNENGKNEHKCNNLNDVDDIESSIEGYPTQGNFDKNVDATTDVGAGYNYLSSSAYSNMRNPMMSQFLQDKQEEEDGEKRVIEVDEDEYITAEDIVRTQARANQNQVEATARRIITERAMALQQAEAATCRASFVSNDQVMAEVRMRAYRRAALASAAQQQVNAALTNQSNSQVYGLNLTRQIQEKQLQAALEMQAAQQARAQNLAVAQARIQRARMMSLLNGTSLPMDSANTNTYFDQLNTSGGSGHGFDTGDSSNVGSASNELAMIDRLRAISNSGEQIAYKKAMLSEALADRLEQVSIARNEVGDLNSLAGNGSVGNMNVNRNGEREEALPNNADDIAKLMSMIRSTPQSSMTNNNMELLTALAKSTNMPPSLANSSNDGTSSTMMMNNHSKSPHLHSIDKSVSTATSFAKNCVQPQQDDLGGGSIQLELAAARRSAAAAATKLASLSGMGGGTEGAVGLGSGQRDMMNTSNTFDFGGERATSQSRHIHHIRGGQMVNIVGEGVLREKDYQDNDNNDCYNDESGENNNGENYAEDPDYKGLCKKGISENNNDIVVDCTGDTDDEVTDNNVDRQDDNSNDVDNHNNVRLAGEIVDVAFGIPKNTEIELGVTLKQNINPSLSSAMKVNNNMTLIAKKPIGLMAKHNADLPKPGTNLKELTANSTYVTKFNKYCPKSSAKMRELPIEINNDISILRSKRDSENIMLSPKKKKKKNKKNITSNDWVDDNSLPTSKDEIAKCDKYVIEKNAKNVTSTTSANSISLPLPGPLPITPVGRLPFTLAGRLPIATAPASIVAKANIYLPLPGCKNNTKGNNAKHVTSVTPGNSVLLSLPEKAKICSSLPGCETNTIRNNINTITSDTPSNSVSLPLPGSLPITAGTGKTKMHSSLSRSETNVIVNDGDKFTSTISANSVILPFPNSLPISTAPAPSFTIAESKSFLPSPGCEKNTIGNNAKNDVFHTTSNSISLPLPTPPYITPAQSSIYLKPLGSTPNPILLSHSLAKIDANTSCSHSKVPPNTSVAYPTNPLTKRINNIKDATNNAFNSNKTTSELEVGSILSLKPSVLATKFGSVVPVNTIPLNKVTNFSTLCASESSLSKVYGYKSCKKGIVHGERKSLTYPLLGDPSISTSAKMITKEKSPIFPQLLPSPLSNISKNSGNSNMPVSAMDEVDEDEYENENFDLNLNLRRDVDGNVLKVKDKNNVSSYNHNEVVVVQQVGKCTNTTTRSTTITNVTGTTKHSSLAGPFVQGIISSDEKFMQKVKQANQVSANRLVSKIMLLDSTGQDKRHVLDPDSTRTENLIVAHKKILECEEKENGKHREQSDLKKKNDFPFKEQIILNFSDLKNLAKHLVEENHKASKEAVKIAYNEMKKRHDFIMSSVQGKILAEEKGDVTVPDINQSLTRKKDNLIYMNHVKDPKLQQDYANIKHQEEMNQLQKKHRKEIDELETEQEIFVFSLLKNHDKAIKGMKEEIQNLQQSHAICLKSYMNASSKALQCLRD